MTDRITAYLVTLDKPIREDDAEAGVLVALRQIRGVAAVRPVVRDGLAESAAITRRDIAWQREIRDLLRYGPRKDNEHE